MKAERLVFKNTMTLGIGKAIGDIAIFLFLIYFSRSFGRDVLGQYAFAMATGGVLSIFVSLGFHTYTIREVSKDTRRTAEFVGQLFLLRLVSAVFCWGLFWLAVASIGTRQETQGILLIIVAYHLTNKLTGIFNAGFMAHEKMMYPTVLGMLERFIILAAGASGIYYSFSPVAILSVYPVSAAIVLTLSYIIFHVRYGQPVFRFDLQFMKKAVRQASPFLVIMILSQFYDRIGIIILTFIKGEGVAGIFMAGDRLLSTINGFSAVFAVALLPSVNRLTVEKRDDFERLCGWASRMVFSLLFPLAALVYIFSDRIILLAFGSEFSASAAILRIACWALVLIGFNQVLAIALIALYRQGQLVRIRMAVYIGYFLLSVLLVWQFSYVGLAWAKIIAEIALFLLTLVGAVKISPLFLTLKRFLLPTTICMLFVFGFTAAGGASLPGAVLFMVLFVVTAFGFKIVRTDDLKALRAWLVKVS